MILFLCNYPLPPLPNPSSQAVRGKLSHILAGCDFPPLRGDEGGSSVEKYPAKPTKGSRDFCETIYLRIIKRRMIIWEVF